MNFSFQNHLRSHRWHAIILAFLLLALFYTSREVFAQSEDIFPAGEGFNGLQVEYSVSGAELGPPIDEEGFTWSRQQDGSLTGDKLVVSGVAYAKNGWGADLVVRLSADGAEPVEFTASKFPEQGLFPDPMEQPFSVSIDIPRGAESASFSISLTGDFNAGGRGVVVSGNLVGGRAVSGQPDSSGGIPAIAIIILAGGAGVVMIAGGAIIAKIASAALKKPAKALKPVRDPDMTKTIDAWEQAAQQADLEAEKYIRQWETVRTSGDPSDPEFQALKQKYQDYIDHQRRNAAEARRQAREIEAQEQEYEQEVRQQQAYRQHRQAESEFIERESRNQARRQGTQDRNLDQRWQEQQQKLEQLKTERKKYRDGLRKDLIEARQAVEKATVDQYIANSVIPALIENQLKALKYKADTAISVIAQVAPTTKPIKWAYKYFSGTADGVGEGLADPENFWEHVDKGQQRGSVDAVVDIFKDELLNYVPSIKRYVKPGWVNLPGGTKVADVSLKEWGYGALQTLISKVRGKFNPIVHSGKWLKQRIGM